MCCSALLSLACGTLEHSIDFEYCFATLIFHGNEPAPTFYSMYNFARADLKVVKYDLFFWYES